MILHQIVSDSEVRSKIRRYEILFGGNKRLKIYGNLQCTSGKKIKRTNRLFFSTEKQAHEMGYRPCGHCMKSEYKKWKDGPVQH